MPQAIPAAVAWAASAWSSAVAVTASAVTALSAGAIAGSAATAVASAGLQFVAMTSLSVAAAALMRPNVPSSGTTLDFKPDPKAPIRGAMGYGAVGGNKVFQGTWGYNRIMLSIGVALSLGPIDQITQFRADDIPVSFAGAQQEAIGFYDADMWQRTTLGLPSDAALLPPTGGRYSTPGLTGWGSQYAAPGTAFAFWTMGLAKKPEDRNIFTNGVPDPRWIGRWMKGWDPRQDSTYPGGSGPHRRNDWRTWTWSENPYVHALAWVRGHYKMNVDGTLDRTRRIAGIGAPDAAIDIAAFVEGMNVSAANGWTISGEWSTSDSKFQTLISMLQAGGGEPISRGAQISVMVNSPRVATYTYTADDLIGAAEVRPLTARRDRKNTITPRYRSEAHGWEYVPAGEVTSQVYRDEDRGEPRSLEVEYVHVRDARQAGQLAAYDLANLREGLTATLPSRAHLMHVHPGDCMVVNVPELALANQKFVVRRTTTNHQSATVTLELRAESDGKHAWALGQAANPPPSPSLSAVDPLYVAPPPLLDWVITPRPPSGDGTSQPGIVVIGVLGTSDIASVIIEYGPSETGPWTTGYSGPPSPGGRYEIMGPEPRTNYWVSVRYVAKNGSISESLVTGPVTTGGLAADIILAGPTVQQLLEDIETERDTAIAGATAAIEAAQADFGASLVDVKERVDGVWAVVGEDDGEGLRRTVIDILENGTGDGGGLTELTTRVEGVEQVVNATGDQALARRTDLTELENAIDATFAKVTQVADLTTRVTSAEGVNAAQNTRLNTVETDVAGKASSTSVSNLASEIATARNGSANLAAQLGNMRQTVTDGLAGKANASDLTSLTTRVANGETTNTAQNNRLNTVEADVAGKASTSTVTDLTSTVNTKPNTFQQAEPPTASGRIIGDLWADSNDNFQLYRWSGTAWLSAHDLRGEAAIAEITAARGGLTTLSARFTSVNTAIADGLAGKASTSSVTSLTSTVGSHTSSISSLQSTTATINGAVNAKVGVVLNANGKISGYSSTNNGVVSTFDVQADKIRFTTGNTAVAPFSVIGSTVYMSNVMIRSAASGERTEITPAGVKVYNAAGALLVQLGIL